MSLGIDVQINLNVNLSEEEVTVRMKILGELIINRIKENIRKMDLISEVAGGQLLQGWFSTYRNNQLIIENTQSYMVYLEFGTYAYWNKFGENTYPEKGDPKKKDLPYELRKMYPRGMQPFAFIRRVLYNEAIMTDLVEKVFA